MLKGRIKKFFRRFFTICFISIVKVVIVLQRSIKNSEELKKVKEIQHVPYICIFSICCRIIYKYIYMQYACSIDTKCVLYVYCICNKFSKEKLFFIFLYYHDRKV